MNRIRELRKRKKLTMKELGAIIGLSESTISLYETGKRQPDFDTLTLIANYFDVSLDYLLGREEKAAEPQDGGGGEAEILRLYRQLSEEGKRRIVSNMKFLIQEQEEEDKRKKGITA